MKAQIDSEGFLKIECASLVEALSEADLRVLAKYAVFQDVLLRGVVDALVDGHMWEDDPEPAWWMGGDTFNNLRLRLVPLLPEITIKAVQHLEAELRHAQNDAKEWRKACWGLQERWPRGTPTPEYESSRPFRTPLSKEECAAYLTSLEESLG